MENYPTNNQENNGSEVKFPSFEEHMAELRGDNTGNEPANTAESIIKAEKTPEQKQVEDLEVLFSFCDEKDVLEILKSDSYGVLLKNDVSLVDLFNADVLFNEQYYADGYTREFEERRYGNKLENFTKRHKDNTKRQWGFVHFLEEEGDYKRAQEAKNDEIGYLVGDKIRAREAKQTIADVAELYFGENAQDHKTIQFLNAVIARANGNSLTDEQKDFLRNEQNEVADRLLYGGKVINEERAGRILSSLDGCEEDYERESSSDHEGIRERADDSLVDRFVYAEAVINDYLEAGKPELVAEATQKLKQLVDKYFEKIVNYRAGGNSDDYEYRLPELILNYSNPFELIERASDCGLTRRIGYDGKVYPGIIEADSIVEAIVNACEGLGTYASFYISESAKALKGLGASDEAILMGCHNLRPVDFIGAERNFDGRGSRLVEAGLDKKKIIKEVFSSDAGDVEPFEKNGYPFKNESYVDVLERNGFDITDIAKTFSPDVISKNLKEFIERGADAKELMKYVASYRDLV